MKIAVTGAFSYSGKYITGKLLHRKHSVVALTNHPERAEASGMAVPSRPLVFDDVAGLEASLRGCQVLVNTYWIRFDHADTTHRGAVDDSRQLVRAAVAAGVQRVVHISITNPSKESILPYFSGKAAVEKSIEDSRMSYAVLRPTVLFGKEDILINNIAWLLRRFPFFLVAGRGDYRLQPVYVDDLAELAVQMVESDRRVVLDTVGPDILTFRGMVHMIGRVIGRERPIFSCPPALIRLAAKALGFFLGDVLLTSDELEGLMSGLLVSKESPRCKTRLEEWLRAHRDQVGSHYASELKRHYIHPSDA